MELLGLENIKGLGFLKSLDLQNALGGIGNFLIVVFIFVVIAGLVGIYLWRIKQKKLYNKKIYFFEEINGAMVPTENCLACELTIPNSNVKVFYIKTKDLYLPRPTKKMGKDAYWYCIRDNREIVNFSMVNMNEEMKEANLDYDHTDMRYALTNLKELIKRNYRDKSMPWWRLYKDVIATVIFIFVLSVAFFFLLSKIGQIADQLSSMISHAEVIMKTACTSSSGVIPQ